MAELLGALIAWGVILVMILLAGMLAGVLDWEERREALRAVRAKEKSRADRHPTRHTKTHHLYCSRKRGKVNA